MLTKLNSLAAAGIAAATLAGSIVLPTQAATEMLDQVVAIVDDDPSQRLGANIPFAIKKSRSIPAPSHSPISPF